MNDIVDKTWNLFVFKTMILSGKLATKKWRTNIGIFFVIQHVVFLPNVFLWRKQNVSKCWSLMWEKKSTKVLAYHKPQVATFLTNDVENDGYCCFAKMVNFGSKTFKMLEFAFAIDLLLSHSYHLWFSKMHCQNLTRKKNAGRNFYATPKFWHKIQDLQKSVEYLLNRPRLPLTKSFLQLWDVLKVVYNAHSWP